MCMSAAVTRHFDSRRSTPLRQFGSLTQFVPQMAKAEQRMAQHHAGAGVAHDLPYAFTPTRAVAMHGAAITGRFIFLEGAVVQTAQGIVQESGAIVA